ncbi:hypothetical protein F5878DRAFT_555797 [Lentinula raphanica]|uniref:RNI-like protein n=1 Tax=Lentinula raphanica TaxID=153919 RepID=A0AA38UIB8_9AGAR|nr:hypothetical protein F5878DRAFT_555797 [Lentinula raphanica]
MASLSSPIPTSPSHPPPSSPSLNSASPLSPSPSPSIHSPRPPPPVRRASTSSDRIPIPGKSILKKPPPPPTGLLSRITSGMSIGKFFGGTPATTATAGHAPEQVVTTTPIAGESSTGGLKRAHFILPEIAVVYPISSNAPPRTPMTDIEKQTIENREKERRKRVVSGEPENGTGWWTMEKVQGFYEECCRAMDVKPDEAISKALLKPSSSLTMLSTSSSSTLSSASVPMSALPSSNSPRTLDLTGVSLTTTQAEILADVLSIEWGLRSLILCESNLDPEVLKPILHALLLNNTLIYLSVASNTGLGNKSLAGRGTGAGYGLSAGLKGAGVTITGGGGLSLGGIGGGGVTGWVVLEAYLSKSRLKVLDLSRNAIDKKAMEGVVKGGLGSSNSSNETTSTPTLESPSNNVKSGSTSLITLTLDSVTLKSGALDVLARAVRTSSTLRTLSLRNCRIGAMGSRGGIAISLMIRDWPDTVAASLSPSPNPSSVSTNSSSNSLSQTSNSGSLNRLRRPAALTNILGEASDTPASLSSAAIPSARSGLKSSSTITTGSVPIQKPLLPPPRHPLPSSLNSSSHPNSHPPLPIPHSHLPPPPPSHSTKNVQTTYTPYVPRSKRGVVAGSGSVPATPTTPMAPMTPTLTTVSRGGVTAVGVPSDDSSSLNSSSDSSHNYSASTITPTTINAITHNHAGSTLGSQPVPPSVAALNSASAALLSQVRALDALPRIGNLRSLDLRGNEMRNHITYLAQVLKRNRTLKSLNLQDNKLDPKALAVLAEALKYNAALEELDLGRNPCCGVVGGSTSQTRSTPTTSYSRPMPTTSSSSSTTTPYTKLQPNSVSNTHMNGSSAFTAAKPNLAYSNQPTYSSSPVPQLNLGLEGIHALRLALALNTTLNRLSLADTHLGDAGAIALAEWMGEYRGLRWLDLTRNSRSSSPSAATGRDATRMGTNGSVEGLGEAGVLALAQGVKVNRTLRCLDVEVPPGVEGYARLSREILNTCIRNVEASEREEQEHGGGLVLGDVFNEQTLRLEETDGRSMTKDPIYGARECIKEIKDYLELMDSTPRVSTSHALTPAPSFASSSTHSPTSSPRLLLDVNTKPDVNVPSLLHRSRTISEELAAVVRRLLEDPHINGPAKEEKIKDVLELSDEVGMLVKRVEEVRKDNDEGDRPRDATDDSDEDVQGKTKEKPALRVEVPSNKSGNITSRSPSSSTITPASHPPPTTVTSPATTDEIFAISDSPSSTSPTNVSSPTFAEGKTTPTDDDTLDLTSDSVEVVGNGDSISSPNRKDKGKARAPPEPIRHEPVLSPTAVLLRNGVKGASGVLSALNGDLGGSGIDSEEEEDEGGEGEDEDEGESVGSGEAEAGMRSRSWVAEEGEVFRKGNILLGPEEMEGEYDGEELRRELLEAMVERPAPRSLHVDDTDDYGSVLTPSALSPTATSPLPSPLSTPLPTPLSPSPASSTLLGPLPEHGSIFDSLSTSSPTTMSVETTATQHAMSSTSSSVRPYIPRTRSSSGTTISTIHG